MRPRKRTWAEFLACSLSAEEYSSRGRYAVPEPPPSAKAFKGDPPVLNRFWLLAGVIYLATSMSLFFANGSSVALVVIVLSVLVMVTTLVLAEFDRRYGGDHKA
jgi:hypothetical protein